MNWRRILCAIDGHWLGRGVDMRFRRDECFPSHEGHANNVMRCENCGREWRARYPKLRAPGWKRIR